MVRTGTNADLHRHEIGDNLECVGKSADTKQKKESNYMAISKVTASAEPKIKGIGGYKRIGQEQKANSKGEVRTVDIYGAIIFAGTPKAGDLVRLYSIRKKAYEVKELVGAPLETVAGDPYKGDMDGVVWAFLNLAENVEIDL